MSPTAPSADGGRRGAARRRGTGSQITPTAAGVVAPAPRSAQVEARHLRLVQEAGRRPVSRSRPSTSTVARSARASAARAFCSTRSDGHPERPHGRASVSKTAAASRGARPAEGSSRIRTRGSTTSARATASICRWPPDRRPAARRRRRAEVGEERVLRPRCARAAAGPGGRPPPSSRFSSHGQAGEDVLGLRDEGEALAHEPMRREPRDLPPEEPDRARPRPEPGRRWP